MHALDDQVETDSGNFFKLKTVFYISALLSVNYIIVALMGSALLEHFERLQTGNIYISVSGWDIPALISLPCFLALAAALVLRLLNRTTEKRLNVCLKVGLFFSLLTIISRPIYGYVISTKMEQSGYSPCWSYSSPSLMSPTVWVRSEAYCIENAGKVRKEILIWMDELPDAGAGVSAEAVRKQANELLYSWDMEDRAKYPHLYK
ncbi:hypothetical protein [Marinobacter caseinilyticus]|uniref:hypothetical protein n=1 Tax=Marinobacter caseinilyticus TaxID=2692195 RepID=UPI00140B7364|nr:hypothetical protein [Marinobacter caseinilyticus]